MSHLGPLSMINTQDYVLNSTEEITSVSWAKCMLLKEWQSAVGIGFEKCQLNYNGLKKKKKNHCRVG